MNEPILGTVNEPGQSDWVEKPWGRFSVVHRGDGHQIKLLTVDPGQELSLQLHNHRSEYWVVLSGRGRAKLDAEMRDLRAGDQFSIQVGAKHRLANHGTAPLEIVEVQIGAYLGEDDIERFDDRYGRV